MFLLHKTFFVPLTKITLCTDCEINILIATIAASEMRFGDVYP